MNEDLKRKQGMYLSQKEVGQIVAVLIIGAFFIFVTGYFFGKKRMLEEVAAHNDVSLPQKIQNSLEIMPNDSQYSPANEEAMPLPKTGVISKPELAKTTTKKRLAYAQLCGFGTKRAAKRYLAIANKQGAEAHIVERKSKARNGRIVTWFQITTNPMERDTLLLLVEKIKKNDKLAGVKIIDLQKPEA